MEESQEEENTTWNDEFAVFLKLYLSWHQYKKHFIFLLARG